ncbi:MAG TPA: hypothetical protein DCO71_01960 [Gammaproteobacteria bacterium]|nr:hypothetical protein [Gammaproteobacteria bacterium]
MLENHIGARLFDRKTRTVLPTPAGKDLHQVNAAITSLSVMRDRRTCRVTQRGGASHLFLTVCCESPCHGPSSDLSHTAHRSMHPRHCHPACHVRNQPQPYRRRHRVRR